MCAEAFGIEEHRLVGASRVREVVIPRHATYYVLRARFPGFSFPRIGALMGGRDHSTIIHGIRNIEALMERDVALQTLVRCLAQGRLPMQADAHVISWIAAKDAERQRAEAETAFRERRATELRERRARDACKDLRDAEFEAALDPTRVHCDQCDRAVRLAEAARCSQRLCGLKARRAASSRVPA